MSHFDVGELRSAVDALTAESARLKQAADALLQKFEALDGLAFTEFDKSLALTVGWTVLADTIGAAGLQIQEQAHQLQREGARLLQPFDTARQLKAEADMGAAARTKRAARYASAEADTQTEADTLRHRLRIGENLSAFERSRAQQLGVLLPPIGDLVESH